MRHFAARASQMILAGVCVCSVQCRSAAGRTDSGPPELRHDDLLLRSLPGEIVFDGPSIAIPTEIAVVGKYVVVADLSADSVFHVIDPERAGAAIQFGRRGSGPGEFEQAWTIDPVPIGSANMWVYDAALARLTHVGIRDGDAGPAASVGRLISLQAPAVLTGPVWVDSTTLVSLGFFARGRVAFLSADGVLRHVVGELPAVSTTAPPEVAQQVNQATLALHPDRSLMVAATRHASNIEIYSADGSLIGIFPGPLTVEPRFAVQVARGRPTMATGLDLRFGYIDVAATEDHIYALFSGRTREGFPGSANFARFVHVFDWSGNFQYALELDATVLTIAVDDAGNFLFATRHEPEPAVLRYGLGP